MIQLGDFSMPEAAMGIVGHSYRIGQMPALPNYISAGGRFKHSKEYRRRRIVNYYASP